MSVFRAAAGPLRMRCCTASVLSAHHFQGSPVPGLPRSQQQGLWAPDASNHIFAASTQLCHCPSVPYTREVPQSCHLCLVSSQTLKALVSQRDALMHGSQCLQQV